MVSAPSFLVAERDPFLRQALVEITAEHFPRAAVYQARDATEAVAAIPRLRAPCVAVLHWSLLDDAALVRFRDASVPVLLTSAWDSTMIAGSGPAAVLLRKPFDLHVYVNHLRELLASWPHPAPRP
jgi:hypothetical protein